MNSRPIYSIIAILLVLLAISISSVYGVSADPDLIERLRASGELDKFVARFQEARTKGVDQPLPRVVDDKFSQQKAVEINQGVVDTLNVLIILADFDDNQYTSGYNATPAEFEDLLFSFDSLDGHYSMTEFYWDNSYGSVYIQGVVSGWYRLPETYAYYVDGQNGFGSYPTNAQRMAQDAIMMADPFVDYSDFDVDGDGWCDGVFVIHAGKGAESTGSDDMIWSHSWSLRTTLTLDGTKVLGYTTEPEEAGSGGLTTMGVFVHEYGHFLGLPDLYDTDYSSSGVGYWSVMAGGSWGGGGADPVFFDAWCKKELGFLNVTNITSNTTALDIPTSRYDPVAFRLWQNATIGNEYFLFENRQRIDHDHKIPGSGLLIYHIDESVGGNSNEWHPLVAVEQADGNFDLENDRNSGDFADPWYTGNVNEFSDLSTPNTRSYANQQTQTSIWDISTHDSLMTANISISWPKPYYVFNATAFSDATYGNNNGVAEPGETMTFTFDLTNLWLTASNVTGTLNSSNGDVIYTQQSSNLGTVVGEGGSADNFGDPIVFDIPITYDPCYDYFTLTVTSDVGAGDTVQSVDFVVGEAKIVIIDDDNGDEWQSTLTNALDDLSVLYDVYDKSNFGSPAAAFLENYEIVMWLSGDDRPDVLSSADIQAMKDYLDFGGSLFLTGQSLAGELSVDDPQFLSDYLKTSYVSTLLFPLIYGVPGSELANGMNVRYYSGTNQTSPETMAAVNGGQPQFQLPVGGHMAVGYKGDYKSLMFSFGFEGISDDFVPNGFANKDSVMMRILTYLEFGENSSAGQLRVDTIDIPSAISINNLTDDSPTFSWAPVDELGGGVTEYQIEVGTGILCDATKNMFESGFISGSDTSLVYSGLPLVDGTSYFFRIRVSNGTDWSAWRRLKFRMNIKPAAANLASPINDALISTTTPNLVLDNAFDADNDLLSYDFELYADAGMATLVTSANDVVETASQTSWTVDVPLTEDAQYFWRAAADDGYEAGDFTGLASFYVNAINVAPSAFNLVTPLDSQQFVGMTPQLVWGMTSDSDPMDNVTYKLQLSDDETFTTVTEFDGITDTTYTVTPDLLDQQYFWRVIAYDAASAETYSTETFSFYTGAKGCCIGMRGNVDGDTLNINDISDLVYMVDYQFRDGDAPVCLEEGDMDLDGIIDVSDLVFLVDYQFRNGDAPPACFPE